MLNLILPLLVASAPAHAYYGRHSTEAVLSYRAAADVPWNKDASLEALNSHTPERRHALALVDRQVQHLMGTFQSQSFKAEFGFLGALGESRRIRFTNVSRGSAPGRALFSYDFRGTVVFQKELFNGHDSRLVPVKLPLAPDLIYRLGLVRSHGTDRNRCTDRTWNDADDFWYYWDPDQPGCPLRGNDTDVLRLTGRLVRRPNTRASYPEYDRLYGDNGNGDSLDVAVFIGYIRDQDTAPGGGLNRHDEALRAFHYVERDLRARGFELTRKRDRFRVRRDGRFMRGINFLRV